MNKINHNQLEKIEKLYKNGQVEIPSRKFLEAMSSVELEEFIRKAAGTPKGSHTPLDKKFAKSLIALIHKGYLDISVEDLELMSEETGWKYYWMGNRPDFSGLNCTQRQCKRIRAMMKESLIEPISENELKSLSFKDAVTLIRKGEDQVMKRKSRRA
jgi:hypothetical protein